MTAIAKHIIKFNCLWFILAMTVGGVAFWVIPEQTISEDENRELTKRPIMTTETIFSGQFSKSFEEYYNDHFPLRNDWIAIANDIKALKGKQSDEFRVITPVSAPPPPKPAEKAQTTQTATSAENTTETTAEIDEVDETEFSRVKGVVVVNGRVVQNFAGSKASVAPYAKMLNTYQEKLPDTVKMYVMMVPAGSDFYLPKQVTGGAMKEKETIDAMISILNPAITNVPAYEEMLPHKNDYLMYRTDHHWTGLGAYYAYRAMARSSGFTPLELSEMTHVKKDKTFMGSLYKYTRDEGLKKNPDFIEYYKLPNHDDIKVYINNTKNTPHTDAKTPWRLFYESANNYGIFLGGDYPLVKITSPAQTGRKLLIIKDSFGNALAPYLASHFDEVFIIDYRHFKGGVLSLIAEHGITDFLYAHNSFAANSNSVVKLGTAMMK